MIAIYIASITSDKNVSVERVFKSDTEYTWEGDIEVIVSITYSWLHGSYY